MELIDRIQYILENNKTKPNISEYEFAKSSNINPNKLSEIRSGKVKSLSPKIALEISKQYGYEFLWILTGEGNMLSSSLTNLSNDCIALERIGINPSCGTGTVVLDDAEVTPVLLGKKLIENIFKVSDVNNLKVFRASGDSMEDTIYDNDDLLVDIGRKDFNNGGIFVLTINNEWFIKRLQLRINGDLDIISDNKAKYQTETKHPNDDIEIIIQGRVIKNLSRGL